MRYRIEVSLMPLGSSTLPGRTLDWQAAQQGFLALRNALTSNGFTVSNVSAQQIPENLEARCSADLDGTITEAAFRAVMDLLKQGAGAGFRGSVWLFDEDGDPVADCAMAPARLVGHTYPKPPRATRWEQ